jgi:hypothetical protein
MNPIDPSAQWGLPDLVYVPLSFIAARSRVLSKEMREELRAAGIPIFQIAGAPHVRYAEVKDFFDRRYQEAKAEQAKAKQEVAE